MATSLPLSTDVIQTRKDGLGLRSLLRIGSVFSAAVFVVRLALRIRRLKVQLVHTNSLKSDLLGGVAARLARRPLIWHVRDRISPDYLPVPVVFVFRNLLPNHPDPRGNQFPRHDADAHGHPSPALPCHSRRNHRPPRGSSTRRFPAHRPGRPNRPLERTGHFPPRRRPTPHQIPQRKIPHHRLRTSYEGIPSSNEDLRKLAPDLFLTDTIEFTGFCDNITEVMSSLTLLVHASTSGEPFGQVVIEAMALAKPVIATNGGGIPEIVEDGHTGLLVPMAGDPFSTWPTPSRQILNNPALQAAEMGKLGRQRVIDHFTIQRTTTQLQQLFQEMPSKKTTAPITTPPVSPLPTTT